MSMMMIRMIDSTEEGRLHGPRIGSCHFDFAAYIHTIFLYPSMEDVGTDDHDDGQHRGRKVARAKD